MTIQKNKEYYDFFGNAVFPKVYKVKTLQQAGAEWEVLITKKIYDIGRLDSTSAKLTLNKRGLFQTFNEVFDSMKIPRRAFIKDVFENG